MEIKYVEENMEKRLYEKYITIYKSGKTELTLKLDTHMVNSSNLEKLLVKGLKMAENISSVWASSDFHDKQTLQKLIFSEGILYNKQHDTVQTLRINSLFSKLRNCKGFQRKRKVAT
ncbi:MAG: hypothetical protein ABIP95_14920 [Pelobium sp.]